MGTSVSDGVVLILPAILNQSDCHPYRFQCPNGSEEICQTESQIHLLYGFKVQGSSVVLVFSIFQSYSRFRVAFWTCVNDLVLHYLFFNAIFQDPFVLERVKLVSLPQLASIAFISGQFFHTKYIAIFGFPSVVAKLDGMVPPWPPICISRVSLYSRMWRYFDRGLYSFLREMLYIPIVGSSGSFMRRTIATAVCFAFVWLWHGATNYYLVWVVLNFLEVMMENAAKEIYKVPSVRLWLDRQLSPTNFRRFTAVLQIPCVAFGIFSIFYFIGGYESGRLISKAFVFNGWPFMYLLGLGYAFCHCCIELEHREYKKLKTEKLFSTS